MTDDGDHYDAGMAAASRMVKAGQRMLKADEAVEAVRAERDAALVERYEQLRGAGLTRLACLAQMRAELEEHFTAEQIAAMGVSAGSITVAVRMARRQNSTG